MASVLKEEAYTQAAECLKILAHPARIRLVHLLMQADYTVGELADACKLQPHVTSEHLRLMEHCGFLNRSKDGRHVYYNIAEPHLKSIMGCIEKRFG